jgi:hypothetical protein
MLGVTVASPISKPTKSARNNSMFKKITSHPVHERSKSLSATLLGFGFSSHAEVSTTKRPIISHLKTELSNVINLFVEVEPQVSHQL